MRESNIGDQSLNFNSATELSTYLQHLGIPATSGNREILLAVCHQISTETGNAQVSHFELDEYWQTNGLELFAKSSTKTAGVASGSRSATQKTACCAKAKNYKWIAWLVFMALFVLAIVLLKYWVNQEQAQRTAVNGVSSVDEGIVANNEAVVVSSSPDVTKQIDFYAQLLKVHENGLEEQSIAFLTGADYTKAGDGDLKHIWFAFDNINSKYNSVNVLTAGSQV